MTTEGLPPEIGALLASLTELTPSNDPSNVFEAALAARPSAPVQAPPTEPATAAFGRAIADVQHTVSLLTDKDWGLAAVNDLTVGELVGHMIGTQLSMAAEFGLETRTNPSTDHIESTRESIDAGATSTAAEAAEEFSRLSTLLMTHLTSLEAQALGAESRFGTIVADVSFLLVVRVFELWTHDNDLRCAVGLGRAEPDPDRLWLMTRTVMPIIDRIGGDRMRIVLTGAGGGVWPAQGDEVAEIAVDSIEFCRRVANRLPLDHLKADIIGDVSAANHVLTDLATLALD